MDEAVFFRKTAEGIDEERDLGKRKERDAKRQHDVQQVGLPAEDGVCCVDEEIGVLIMGKQREIADDCSGQEAPADSRVGAVR